MIGAGASQQLIKRIGIRRVAYIGMTLGALGLLWFTRLTPHSTYLVHVFPTIAIVSIGMGMTFVPLTLLATQSVQTEDAGLASGLFNTSQQVGGALGLAILSTLAASRTGSSHDPGKVVSGYHVAFLTGAALLVAGIVVLVVGVRRRDEETIDPTEMPLPA